MKTKCMRCGKIHPYYEFTQKQLEVMLAPMYVLYCENCGTQMHEPVEEDEVSGVSNEEIYL